jgi:hypothetical protein
MPKFEAHLTLPKADRDIASFVGETTGWTFSEIDGDPLMGAKPYCYLTAYEPDATLLLSRMRGVAHSLRQRGVAVLREKVEQIIYDTKTNVNEIESEVG